MTRQEHHTTADHGTEPGWVRHAIWWHLYPLGFVDAFPEPPSGPAQPEEHRLLRVIGWLDHAAGLGASGIALGPIFDSATHGYDTLDYLRIDPRLGTDDDFDQLVTAAHARGLRIKLDGVFNHVAREHPRVQAALAAGPGSEEMRWFRPRVTDDGHVELDTFEGHEQLIALNHDEPEVRAHVADVMRHWLDRGADAWRLDAAYRVPTDFWAAVLPEVRRTHPDVWFEAEVIHGDCAAFVEASTADTVTQYELWKAIWSSIENRNFFELDWALRRHSEMLQDFVPATFVGNHDVTRIASQISDQRHLPHAVALLAVLGGTPSIYAGDELGYRAVKEDRPGGDDAVRPAFAPDGPGRLDAGSAEVLRLHQRLVGLRRRHPWLREATSQAVAVRNEQYVITVGDGGQTLTLALNLSDAELGVPGGTVLDGDPRSRAGDGVVGPHGWAILEA
ncbi:MAG: alpha-amylase family glycosyl hydrolase [Promicromonosporaceae bacterium]|nr:alpha-amylase family glycosyl hydrolase [Promicromonosporaceae bacterium]